MVRKVNVNVIREFKNNISKYIAIMILITVSITVALGLNKPLNIEKYNKERFFEKYNLEDGNFQILVYVYPSNDELNFFITEILFGGI